MNKVSKFQFRNTLGETIFNSKYAHQDAETWPALARTLVEQVCNGKMNKGDMEQLIQYMSDMKFIPGGRYLYYAGRPVKFFNNCFLLSAIEDTREDWAYLSWKAERCLMVGGGIGVDYSIYRQKGLSLSRTGGVSSGPIPKMKMLNEIGRNVIQGGSRRSALYASLNWQHRDINEFMTTKDWNTQVVAGTGGLTIGQLKEADFNFPAPLDMTNISVNYDTAWIEHYKKAGEVGDIFMKNIRQALSTGEPGFSFNFYDKENETLRNACTEVTSSDDSDVCNLGSLNLSRIESIEELKDITRLASQFLICGTLVADLPYEKVYEVREKNRRLGLGLMGIHEWLLARGYRYEMNPEFASWMEVYRDESERGANELADRLGINRPVAYRAIAPTGTISLISGTTSGIEPLYTVAYKRRYMRGSAEWYYQYTVDSTAKQMINDYDLNPDDIETSIALAKDPERRIAFQADIQDYVDQSISSTINLPQWGTEDNNITHVKPFAETLAKYAGRLRGFTCYPDGSRGGQPLTSVPYGEAISKEGEEFKEEFHDICDITGGGICGV